MQVWSRTRFPTLTPNISRRPKPSNPQSHKPKKYAALDPANSAQMTMFLKNVAMAGGYIALAVAGAGALALDGRLRPATAA